MLFTPKSQPFSSLSQSFPRSERFAGWVNEGLKLRVVTWRRQDQGVGQLLCQPGPAAVGRSPSPRGVRLLQPSPRRWPAALGVAVSGFLSAASARVKAKNRRRKEIAGLVQCGCWHSGAASGAVAPRRRGSVFKPTGCCRTGCTPCGLCRTWLVPLWKRPGDRAAVLWPDGVELVEPWVVGVQEILVSERALSLRHPVVTRSAAVLVLPPFIESHVLVNLALLASGLRALRGWEGRGGSLRGIRTARELGCPGGSGGLTLRML